MRTVVVTGSASGIGRATRDLLQSRGHRVIGVDVHDADVVADLSTTDGRARLVEGVRELGDGRLDAVVANAGLAHESPATVAVDFFGAVATLDGLRDLLTGSTAPRAAATASMAGLLGADDELVERCLAGDEPAALERAEHLVTSGRGGMLYPSAKRALCRWVRRHAATPEWAGAGIPLNAIAPGIVRTPMVADLIATPEQRDAMAQAVPMPLNGYMDPEVPARLLAWLVDEENSHLCGQVVFVDGGSDVVLRGDTTW
ncbi:MULTISPECIES: SDR family oxidoreductase [unclassified Isoptericola]|uniref:SDR family oxidoreductase n=1 Tax=unclassified Isoptericola TaxID=2623355 RepID=UPI002712C02B|nr:MULTISPECIES: SDR family oxidoreductase [unclassified Isoptericola]MDO8144806.1 SDR family oxidoreductase [Isoptericola sp. 178]MDO8149586.1 SDR family oxidoreductase [Isoptericola sp. b515]MDO8152520.1 SDR family oxidoreductase [Isoptericola sp. b408]